MPACQKGCTVASYRSGFWTAAAVIALALWGSAAPTILYPLYSRDWAIGTTETGLLFAVYPAVLVVVLLMLGNLSDTLGRRRVILIGLAALVGGELMFALADGFAWAVGGRALMAAGVGLSLSPATALLVAFAGRDGAGRASTVATLATAVGVALSTVLGGAVVEFVPYPLHSTYWVLVAVTAAVTVASLWLPRHTTDQASGRWRPNRPKLSAENRAPFVAGTSAMSAAFAQAAVYLSLGAQAARDLIRSDSPFVDGSIIALSAVAIGASAILVRRVRPRLLILIGTPTSALALGLMSWSGILQSLPLFLAASVVGGAAYGLLFAGGLGLVTRAAPEHQRAGVLSAAYVVSYFVQGAVGLGLGWMAAIATLSDALAWSILLTSIPAAVAAIVVLFRGADPVSAVD